MAIEIAGNPDHEQAAAIAAAIERFNADTAPAPSPSGPRTSGWQRANLLENVGAMPRGLYPWGEPRGWGTLRR